MHALLSWRSATHIPLRDCTNVPSQIYVKCRLKLGVTPGMMPPVLFSNSDSMRAAHLQCVLQELTCNAFCKKYCVLLTSYYVKARGDILFVVLGGIALVGCQPGCFGALSGFEATASIFDPVSTSAVSFSGSTSSFGRIKDEVAGAVCCQGSSRNPCCASTPRPHCGQPHPCPRRVFMPTLLRQQRPTN